MPKRQDVKKVLVIGSGPIIIGQAAEFDYAGTQACRALKEEGIEVVLVNSNPATIMTDTNIADKVYIEPLNVEVLKRIIEKERPDSILPTLGGQTGLNLATELWDSGILEKYSVKLLGTSPESIKMAEDRDMFKETMRKIGEPILESSVATDVEEALKIAEEIGYPVIIRPAFTLGGTGGGIANNPEELADIVRTGISYSRVGQVLIEKCITGWKEIEYEVMRDGKGNCITVCNMENIDPLGIHTGDSIVVAPSQTLSDKEYQMLRSAAINIISALKIEGGCNVQFALDPVSFKYYVIEVNPRVSRSSALASKATGYPIAKVATKIALGYTLDEIKNAITKKTYACFEPALDYVVVKIPRWPFDKFYSANRKLGTQMKATGEVMAIGTSFESALLKAIRSLEIGIYSFNIPKIMKYDKEELIERIKLTTDERLFLVANAMRKGVGIDELNELTGIDKFFLNKIKKIVDFEEKIKGMTLEKLDKEVLLEAKKMGFSDRGIGDLLNVEEDRIRELRKSFGIYPSYKMVDTCAAEFEASTPYFYSTYHGENESIVSNKPKVVVIGSGPIRIGQGIEFDYCCVHSIWALKEKGYEAIIINNNPETVSTDFDTSDKLYFEPLTDEDVLNIIDLERPEGVIVQFGGQTAIKLTRILYKKGIKVLGTHPESIDIAEDREKFDKLLEGLKIPRPKGGTVTNLKDALMVAEEIGYPVLVRPSYVLGGQGMQVVYADEELKEYMEVAVQVSEKYPVLIDKYILGKEVEVDAICDGEDILIPGIMEHLERAGVHSGDSISVYPSQTLSNTVKDRILDYTVRISRALKVRGLINIQYVVKDDMVYVLEVNPRSSRTVPYISKVTGVPMVNLATKIILGDTLREMGYGSGLWPEKNLIAVKVPVFSFEKLPEVDICLGPEMKSTGEVLGISGDLSEALYKGIIAAGIKVPDSGNVLITVADIDKKEIVSIAKEFKELGFNILATEGTAEYLKNHGIEATVVNKLSGGYPTIYDLINENKIQLVINTPTKGRMPERDGFVIRQSAVRRAIPCLTSLDTARGILRSIKVKRSKSQLEVDYLR